MLEVSIWTMRHEELSHLSQFFYRMPVNLSGVSVEGAHLFECRSFKRVSCFYHLYGPVFSFQLVCFSGECVNQIDIYKEGMVFPGGNPGGLKGSWLYLCCGMRF